MTDRPESLAAAVALLQTRLPRIEKSERAVVETRTGSYTYSYANLSAISAAVLPLLGTLGLAFIAKPSFVGDRFVLAYKLLHVSGEYEAGEYPLPTSGTPQAIGSAITYARRYCLAAVTGIAPEDDDDASAAQAEAAASRGTAQRASRPRTQAPTAERMKGVGETDTPGGTITDAQMRKMQAMFSERGYATSEERRAFLATVIDRPLTSTRELTKDEAGKVIERLEQTPATTEPPA